MRSFGSVASLSLCSCSLALPCFYCGGRPPTEGLFLLEVLALSIGFLYVSVSFLLWFLRVCGLSRASGAVDRVRLCVFPAEEAGVEVVFQGCGVASGSVSLNLILRLSALLLELLSLCQCAWGQPPLPTHESLNCFLIASVLRLREILTSCWIAF